MGNRKGMIYAALERFDGLMAIGESRHAAKIATRAASGTNAWTVSTGKIHSHTTRKVYQQHTFAFLNWARTVHRITRLEQVDERVDELATLYLTDHLACGRSAYTVQTERAALRMFFGKRDLAADIAIPACTRTSIRRSRGSVPSDRHFQPAHWQAHLAFVYATGLRRSELRDLRVRDVFRGDEGTLFVHVKNGKGGRPREVPVLAEHEPDVLVVIQGRLPEEKVFASLPKHMNVHRSRRASAQARYLHHAPGKSLPSTDGALKRSEIDREAVQHVSHALGHNRQDVVLRHYIR